MGASGRPSPVAGTLGTAVVRSERLARADLSGSDWGPIRLRARYDLKALVVAADPKGLGQYDSLRWMSTARSSGPTAMSGLAAIKVVRGPRTFDQFRAEMRYAYDILYLVCHGSLDDDGRCVALSGR